jgi:hypothetical protein
MTQPSRYRDRVRQNPRLVALVPYLAVVGVLLAVAFAIPHPHSDLSAFGGVLLIWAGGVAGIGVYRTRRVK